MCGPDVAAPTRGLPVTLPNPEDARHGVYTTMQPDVRVEVSTAERDELAAQGLLAREDERPEVRPADEARAEREASAGTAAERPKSLPNTP
jgi:hypothetical protein